MYTTVLKYNPFAHFFTLLSNRKDGSDIFLSFSRLFKQRIQSRQKTLSWKSNWKRPEESGFSLARSVTACLQKWKPEWRAWPLSRVQAKRTGRIKKKEKKKKNWRTWPGISSGTAPKLERSFLTGWTWIQPWLADLFAMSGELQSIATESSGQKSIRCSQ